MRASSDGRLGVGLVGLTPGRSWAAVAHLPALAHLSGDFEVTGVANSSLASARNAVAQTGVGKPLELEQLLQSPDTDIVAVTVKVSGHYDILERAIAAGKNVYCEWPLALNLDDARDLAAQAKAAGVLAVIGTQGVVSPEIAHLQHLVESGSIGSVLSTTITAAAGVWGQNVSASQAYSLNKASGANLLTVPFGHLVPMVEKALGPISMVSAELATGRTKVRVVETGELVDVTSPDQLAVAGVLGGGAILSVHFRGGSPSGEAFSWEIYGTEGVLRLAGDRGQPQMASMRLFKGRHEEPLQEIAVPDENAVSGSLKGPARNVGLIYARMASDIRDGTRKAPSFDQAVRTHQVIAAVEQAASTHRRVRV